MSENLHDRLLEWCCGDEDAAQFLWRVYEAAQAWDDIRDEGGSAQADAAIAWLAFGKEMEPWFARHGHLVRPVMLRMYLDWQAANALEAAPDETRLAKAYVLRAGFYGLCHVVAYFVGGHDHAVRIAAALWDEYGETPAQHRAEFKEG